MYSSPNVDISTPNGECVRRNLKGATWACKSIFLRLVDSWDLKREKTNYKPTMDQEGLQMNWIGDLMSLSKLVQQESNVSALASVQVPHLPSLLVYQMWLELSHLPAKTAKTTKLSRFLKDTLSSAPTSCRMTKHEMSTRWLPILNHPNVNHLRGHFPQIIRRSYEFHCQSEDSWAH